MRSATVYACLSLMAGVAMALPRAHVSRQASGAQNVVYWGQNGGGTIENNDLSTYCTSTSGIDIIVLAFLYSWGTGGDIPSGTVGQSCFISNAGEGQNCDALSAAITTCQSVGIKVILSLGGATSSYSLSSQAEAESIGDYLWKAYGNSGDASVQRPFGNVIIDGFDFDIEVNRGSEYYPYMISTLRSNFASDSSKTYYITGAPQCPIPEPNMGVIIGNSTFDYLWPQFYNNNNYTYPCALPINGNAPFNYDEWVSWTAGTPSANAKIFLGVPAAPLAANGGPGGATYYATPDQLASIVNEYKSDSRFGGVMMWSAGFSDSNVNDGCTYAQEVHNILVSGSPCASGPITSTRSTTSVPPATGTSSSPTSTATGTVAQWGQCGGQGYTGPTQCESPYTCVATSGWWSQCE
ncbi:putative endochitinase CHI2 [Hypoxylon rubiginosum]|uniref:Endochitinase CHI2 n=1 Tax=Hypoxylon rubiginosum TaxID=110542 RepID=A0ACB9YKK6_9PEZI|nr:putative endochitinase CHI2 [Hypoxylon rubiginosum]